MPLIIFIIRRGSFVVLAHASIRVLDPHEHQDDPKQVTVAKHVVTQGADVSRPPIKSADSQNDKIEPKDDAPSHVPRPNEGPARAHLIAILISITVLSPIEASRRNIRPNTYLIILLGLVSSNLFLTLEFRINLFQFCLNLS